MFGRLIYPMWEPVGWWSGWRWGSSQVAKAKPNSRADVWRCFALISFHLRPSDLACAIRPSHPAVPPHSMQTKYRVNFGMSYASNSFFRSFSIVTHSASTPSQHLYLSIMTACSWTIWKFCFFLVFFSIISATSSLCQPCEWQQLEENSFSKAQPGIAIESDGNASSPRCRNVSTEQSASPRTDDRWSKCEKCFVWRSFVNEFHLSAPRWSTFKLSHVTHYLNACWVASIDYSTKCFSLNFFRNFLLFGRETRKMLAAP